MNSVCFVCRTCKTYTDAGYRWCYWKLEHPGIISRSEPVFVEAVFESKEYWEIEKSDPVLPKVRRFLEKHREHHITYGDHFSFLWTDEQLEWMDEEEDLESADLSPRLFVERLGYTHWEQAVEHIENQIKDRGYDQTYWWDTELSQPANKVTAQWKFEDLVQQRQKSETTDSQEECK